MTNTRTATVLLAALAALALSACSGDDARLTKAEYEAEVRAAYSEVQDAFQRTSAPREELAERLDDASAALTAAATKLEEVLPPEEVEEENEEIVEGLREYAEEVEMLHDAAERGDETAIAAFNARIGDNEAVEQIAEAAEEMKFKGYDLGPIADE